MYEALQKKEKSPVQKKEVKKPNNTGIPTTMKNRYESMSGFSFDDVKVHYNSDRPAQLLALAYTQGNQVYVAPGQEKHLGHELGHVVQQKQGIVKPTKQINGVLVNDDPTMETEADKLSTNIKLDIKTGAYTDEKQPIQCLRDKYSLDEKTYSDRLRSTVLLYAELDGKPVGEDGRFTTTRKSHAEENLINHILKQGITTGALTIYLSTSPCSSEFGTRKDDELGCAERLEHLSSSTSLTLNVKASHVYQPKELGAVERELFGPGSTGMSSWASIGAYNFIEINDEVAQLMRKENSKTPHS